MGENSEWHTIDQSQQYTTPALIIWNLKVYFSLNTGHDLHEDNPSSPHPFPPAEDFLPIMSGARKCFVFFFENDPF